MKHLNKIFNLFFRGLLFAGPVLLTVYLFILIFRWIDHIIPIEDFFPKDLFYIPGIGVIFIFFFFCLVGYFSRNYFFKKFVENISLQIIKIPFVKFLFSSIKDLISAFNQKESKFKNPVLIKISNMDIYELGFLVQEDMSLLGVEDLVCVYVPFSFGFMGKTIMVKNSQIVQRLQDRLSSADVLKFMISGGISSFENIKEKDVK